MNFVNLTDKPITEVVTGKQFQPSGAIVTLQTVTTAKRKLDGIPVFTTDSGVLHGLPDPVTDTIYIIPSMCMEYVPNDRDDVVSPGSLQRDRSGTIIGCKGFRRNYK